MGRWGRNFLEVICLFCLGSCRVDKGMLICLLGWDVFIGICMVICWLVLWVLGGFLFGEVRDILVVFWTIGLDIIEGEVDILCGLSFVLMVDVIWGISLVDFI